MTQARRIGRLTRWYPFLLVTVPVLNVAARSPGQASLDDLAVVLAAVLSGCVIVYGAAALASGRRGAGRLPALAALAAVVWFYGYPQIVGWFGHMLGSGHHLLLVPVGLGLTIGLAWWLLARPAALDRLAILLTITGGLLVAWQLSRIVAGRVRAREALQRSELVRRLARPIEVRPGVADRRPRRDIYLIVLDEYANSSVTRERFGFDNAVFQDSLRRLGFVIPPVVHSNYLLTTLSLPSLLNSSHLIELSRELGPYNTDPTVPNYLVEHNRTVAFLSRQGYRFVFFPSQWWLSTRHNREANLEFRAWLKWSSRELSHSELRRAVRRATILDLFQTDHADDADHVSRTFAGMARVSALSGPSFVFAHILKPHRPYAFDRHCRVLPRRETGRRGGGMPFDGYVGQVHCINNMVLRLVDTLLRASAVPPIILLQGDHGTKQLNYNSAVTAARMDVPAARERLGAFGAYYLPDGGAAAFGDTVTVVNVLGNVLRYYFGADLPREPDIMYLSIDRSPYDFQPVDFAWIGGRDRTPAPRSTH